MSLVYCVVQFSFHDQQWYPFVHTGTERAYTIMKAVLINHIFAHISFRCQIALMTKSSSVGWGKKPGPEISGLTSAWPSLSTEGHNNLIWHSDYSSFTQNQPLPLPLFDSNIHCILESICHRIILYIN